MNERIKSFIDGGRQERELARLVKSATESIPSEEGRKNEDVVLNDPEIGLFGVFDGLGGEINGVAPSRLAAQSIERHIRSISENTTSSNISAYGWGNKLIESFRNASREIELLQRSIDKTRKPDTTALVAKFLTKDGKKFVTWAGVGNSRMYLKQKDGLYLELLTEDDDPVSQIGGDLDVVERSNLQRTVRAKLDQASHSRDLEERVRGIDLKHLFSQRSILTQTLGHLRGEVRVGWIGVDAGDILILVSDGIHKNLTKEEISDWVSRSENPREIRMNLARTARIRSRVSKEENIRAHPDDMSVIAIEVQ